MNDPTSTATTSRRKAPSNGALAKFWPDLLGIDRVGAEDSFFDLGGHSLIAVRLFAMVKSAFRVEFPISVLFEAPTIRKCAVLIVQHGGGAEGEDGADAPSGATATPARRFTHLVPMHQGQGGEKTPLFLVAGMFGNVLNLRHLAHLLSPDRPFYGLQARGLLGGDAPHDNLVEAATDCIAEMRQVQPSGPYMLGGFSGGGITAFEMAQQLSRDGEEVASLVLLDTPLPQERQMTRRDRIALQRIRLAEEGPRYLWNWAARRVAWEIEKRRAKDFESSSTEFHNAEIESAFRKAISTYQVSDWAGAMTLFRPPLDKRWEVAAGPVGQVRPHHDRRGQRLASARAEDRGLRSAGRPRTRWCSSRTSGSWPPGCGRCSRRPNRRSVPSSDGICAPRSDPCFATRRDHSATSRISDLQGLPRMWRGP